MVWVQEEPWSEANPGEATAVVSNVVTRAELALERDLKGEWA